MNQTAASTNTGAMAGALLLAAALLLGGGGTSSPVPELILELMFAAAFALWAAQAGSLARVPAKIWAITALIVLIPALQLVPLPPVIWQALPGRELQREALELVGQSQTWRAWSLAPDRTLASLLSLGPPLALLIMTSTFEWPQRAKLLAVLYGVAVLTLIVGALQLGSGPDGPMRFYGGTDLVLTGFQANRNSTADLLLIAMVGLPALIVELVRQNRFPPLNSYIVWTSIAGMALCLLGVVLTSSRTGIVLLPVALLGGALVLNTWLRLSWRKLALGGLAAIAALALAAWLLWNQTSIANASSRFVFDNELRPELWRDAVFVTRQFFPFGTGMGGFIPAMIAAERLEIVLEALPVRAHNDFLELVLEAGAFGAAALSAIFLIIAGAARRALKAGSSPRVLAIFAIMALFLIALHSVVDYPLRSMTLACLAAVCTGMLVAPRNEQAGAQGTAQSWEHS